MELRQIRSFVALADTLSFTLAAKRLGIAQPPLSVHIKQLEASVGATLFSRTSRKVALTAAGQVFLRQALEILKRSDDAVRSVRDVIEGRQEPVRIGIGPAGSSPQLAKRFRKFAKKHRGVRLLMDFADDAVLAEGLASKTLDFALLSGPSAAGEDARIFSEPLSIIVPRKHRLAEKEAVQLLDLVGEQIWVGAGEDLSFAESFARRLHPELWAKLQPIPTGETVLQRLWRVGAGAGMVICQSHEACKGFGIAVPIDDCMVPCFLIRSFTPGVGSAEVVADFISRDAESTED
jgi:DNA-binding transcriptional LysR family regulator